MKFLAFLIPAVLLAVILTACGGERAKYRIAVIPKGTSHEFWKAVESGARQADAELEDVSIVWKGPTGEGDENDQITIVESFIANGYEGICLAPLDGRALVKPVEQAQSNGIPVVIFDSALDPTAAPIVSFVATDNVNGGRMAADHLASLLGEKGNVILMRYAVGSRSTEEREKGFLEAMARYPEIKIISSDKRGGPDESASIKLGQDLMATFRDQVDGIFCPNESTISGMLTVMERDFADLAQKVKLVGFDSSKSIIAALKKGTLHGTILQNPVKMGYESVRLMHAYLSGRRDQVQDRFPTGETLVTPDNMDEPTIRKLLSPGQEP